MKKDIHPKYYKNAKITCVCGNVISTGSTVEEINTELCSKCHPFYTGTQKLVDTARRVDKFKQREERSGQAAKSRQGKKVKRAKRAEIKQEVSKKAKKVNTEK